MKILKTKRVSRSLGGNIAIKVFLALIGVFTALPLVYTMVTAFKPLSELFLFPPRFFVYQPTTENFRSLLQLSGDMLEPFERYIFNSVFTTVVGTLGYIIVASFAAYPLAKHNFPAKVLILQTVVWAILFRTEVTSIPQYNIIAGLKMIDTYWAIILPAMAGSFGVFLMRQFMTGIPDDIIEAARVDGLGEIRIFWRIIMPMIKPAWITLTIFTFQAMWNTTGVQFVFSEDLKMLPVALQQISTVGFARAGVGSAIAFILMLPPVVIYIFCQNAVLDTMAHSGLKS